LVRDPHIRGTTGEYAGAAANLRVVLATHIVVEAYTRREQEVDSRKCAAVVMDRRTARIAERHRVRYPVVIRGVLEFRRIHAQSAGDREIGTRPPLILRIRAG